jgi:hypothetical protein
MPAIARPHRAALLLKLRDLWCGGAVLRNRLVAAIRVGANELCTDRSTERDAGRNMAGCKMTRQLIGQDFM